MLKNPISIKRRNATGVLEITFQFSEQHVTCRSTTTNTLLVCNGTYSTTRTDSNTLHLLNLNPLALSLTNVTKWATKERLRP